MTEQDRLILLASLMEIKEAHNDLYTQRKYDLAEALRFCIFDRAARLNNGLYADPDNRGTPPHTN